MIKTTTCDSAALPPAEAKTLAAMVEKAGLSGKPATEGQTKQPDRFNYELTIEDEGPGQTFMLAEENLSAEVKSLIEWVGASPSAEVRMGPPGHSKAP